MKKLAILFTVFAVLAMSVVPSFAQEEPTIADLVVATATGDAPEFAILLTAVQAADPAVLEGLSDPEAELTVFAPTDAAFGVLMEELGDEAVAALLADPEALTEILLYHVVEGAAMSADVVAALEENEGAFTIKTLNGQYLNIAATEEGGVTVDNSNIVLEMVDIEASNGVIHVIDAVLVPETRTVAEIVTELAGSEEPEFTTLLTAVAAADPAVLEALSDPEAELTVFAPTDAAFAAVDPALLEAVLADQALLTSILLYHVYAGVAGSADIVPMAMEADGTLEIEMLDGSIATVTLTEDGAMINEANIIISASDVDAANGIIHVIDAVLVPASE